MTKIFEDWDPFEAITETSFTNAAISRCLIGAQIFYLITYVANFAYGQMMEDQAALFQQALLDTQAEASSNEATVETSIELIEVKAKRVLCIVCLVAIANLMLQLTAMVNQRRYRVAFYSTFGQILLSCLLLYIEDSVNYYLYCYQAGYYTEKMIEEAQQEWTDEQASLPR